jgi:hypothetical protein
MILSVEAGDAGELFDANGVEIKYAVWADTDTGEVAVLVMDESGRPLIAVNDRGEREPRKKWQHHHAPLKFVGRQR